MSKECEALRMIKERIENGEDPETAIPYHLNVDDDVLREICFYALQVLPEGRRKDNIRKYWEEHYAGR